MNMRKAGAWRIGIVGAVVGVVSLVLSTLPPITPSHSSVVAAFRPSEAWLYDRDGALLDSQRVDFHARRLAWVPLTRIAPAVRTAIVASEDKRFAIHGGVDMLALANAGRAWLTGSPGRGASTISMQVAALLAPELARPGNRGWRDKLRQIRGAWALEERWSKAQILEAYLNLADYRGEASGIGAASVTLFGKSPDALTQDQATLMAAVLPAPGASIHAVVVRACRLSPARCTTLNAIAGAALSNERHAELDPGLAPHLAARLLTRPGQRVRTTIDADVQRLAASALRRQLQGLGTRARDGAVVVVHNASGDVLAYVGGVGLGSTAAAVDGADAYRQAGSTLKPFLYAQAIERGWLTSASILDDSPVQLDTASGLYVPQNHDRSFRGPVSVRGALAGSLNVPAVRTLLLTGVEAFRDRLWDLGYHGLGEDGGYYGFSLALGSAEVTLLEQANAFRTLANGGAFSPLRLSLGSARPAARGVISPEAAWITADILADASARSASFGVDSALRLPFWAAAKTGTSKGMRDNWCIGFSGSFTVAVWVGNLEGDPMRAVSGTSGAAPIWRDVMLALHRGVAWPPPPPPAGIEQRHIVFASGTEPPRAEWFVRGTGQAVQAMTPAEARRPRIVNPASGSVYAIDPDIPLSRQRIGVAVTGATTGHTLIIDRRRLGRADARPQVLAGPGIHRIALIDPAGRVVDQVRFTVR